VPLRPEHQVEHPADRTVRDRVHRVLRRQGDAGWEAFGSRTGTSTFARMNASASRMDVNCACDGDGEGLVTEGRTVGTGGT
jgi:hypothetical protein